MFFYVHFKIAALNKSSRAKRLKLGFFFFFQTKFTKWLIENKCLYWCHFQKILEIMNKWITIQLPVLEGFFFPFLAKVCCVFSGLWVVQYISFYSSTNVFVLIHPLWRCPDKERGCQNDMLICPHTLPVLLLYYCQWKIRGFRNALAEEQRKTEAATEGEP